MNRVNKTLIFFNYSIGALIAITYSMKIDFSGINPHFGEWLSLLFLLVFTAALLGTPVWLLSILVIAISNKNPNAIMSNESLEVSKSAFNSIGIATAYTMVLYFFGLSDTFFSFALFYI